jgi:F-box interacting protein
MDLIATKIKDTLFCYNLQERRLKTYRRRGDGPSIPDELVYEILIRLPVKTLCRSKSVCKTWCTIISNPSFIHMHLKQSAARHERDPSFLITPHTLSSVIDDELWPSTFSNNIPFYHWQDGQDNACLVHMTDFHGDFGSVYCMSQCDGLVMLPTDKKIYVWNPAMGDVLKLPDGQKNNKGFQTAGLGLDHGTNSYKVVRSFYRYANFAWRTYSAGMEVFTIGGHDSRWRIVEDPPYPLLSQLPLYCKGSLYWHICKELLESPPEGFLRFNLEDETFSFICHPVLPSKDDRLDFLELGGELCLTQYLTTQIVIWKSPSGDNHQWDRLYVMNLTEAWKFHPFEFLSDRILLRSGNHIYRYDEASRTAKEVVCLDQLRYKDPRMGNLDFVGEYIYYFNIVPYTESLVPLTRPG